MFGQRPKYNAKKVVVDGIKFDSKRESEYYCELKKLKTRGIVTDFEMQVPFVLLPSYKKKDGKTERGVKYIADFVVHYADGYTEVIDVKGYRTDVYKIKRKFFLAKYPDMNFREV